MTPQEHKDRIILSPVGDFQEFELGRIAKLVGGVFGFKTEILPLLEDVSFAFNGERQQYHSTVMLEHLDRLAPSQGVKVAAMTTVDLYIPILTYVFGEAQLNGRACIVSTYRLKEELPAGNPQQSLATRLAKETLHELGHPFNLRHCPEANCIMHYCRHSTDVDRKSDQFCRYCKVMLGDALKQIGSHAGGATDRKETGSG